MVDEVVLQVVGFLEREVNLRARGYGGGGRFEILGERRRDTYIGVICPFTVRHVAGRTPLSPTIILH